LYRPVTNADYPALEKVSESAIKEKQKFERLVVSKEKLLEMFNVRQLFEVFFFSFFDCSGSHLKSYIVQQIQKVHDRNQGSRWYLHDSISLWSHG
jgi:threonyl-tRNA synthetase